MPTLGRWQEMGEHVCRWGFRVPVMVLSMLAVEFQLSVQRWSA